MIYKQVAKRAKLYNYGDIVGLHKYAYYGDKDKFSSLITSTVMEEYFETLYYCITQGCKKEYKFANYILNNFEFIDIKYKRAITATYIRNGEYDERLFLEEFDYYLFKNADKDKVKKLIKYKELHNVLNFIAILNSFTYDIELTTTKNHATNILAKYYNLPDNKKFINCTDYTNFLLTTEKYTKEEMDPYLFNLPPGDVNNICNLERELFITYILNNFKEIKPLEINEINIIKDVRVAIEAYSQNKFINTCLSKFALVAPKDALPLVEKNKPFLEFGNNVYNFDFLEDYLKINPLYIHNFIYNNIMYHKSTYMKHLPDTIDYSFIEACIYSCNYSALKRIRNKNIKCYKYLDYENKKYLDTKEEIIIDYEEIISKLKFDVKKYPF